MSNDAAHEAREDGPSDAAKIARRRRTWILAIALAVTTAIGLVITNLLSSSDDDAAPASSPTATASSTQSSVPSPTESTTAPATYLDGAHLSWELNLATALPAGTPIADPVFAFGNNLDDNTTSLRLGPIAFPGTWVASISSATSPQDGLSLAGLDPVTGKITWVTAIPNLKDCGASDSDGKIACLSVVSGPGQTSSTITILSLSTGAIEKTVDLPYAANDIGTSADAILTADTAQAIPANGDYTAGFSGTMRISLITWNGEISWTTQQAVASSGFNDTPDFGRLSQRDGVSLLAAANALIALRSDTGAVLFSTSEARGALAPNRTVLVAINEGAAAPTDPTGFVTLEETTLSALTSPTAIGSDGKTYRVEIPKLVNESDPAIYAPRVNVDFVDPSTGKTSGTFVSPNEVSTAARLNGVGAVVGGYVTGDAPIIPFDIVDPATALSAFQLKLDDPSWTPVPRLPNDELLFAYLKDGQAGGGFTSTKLALYAPGQGQG